MRADSQTVLLDLISGEFSVHLTKTQRLNAVAAIAELSSDQAEAKLAEIAGTEQLEPEVRAAALEALVAGRPDRLARWLNPHGEHATNRWRRLAEIRRRGVELDLAQVGWLNRLLLSVKARRFHAAELQPDLLASGVWGGLGLVVVLVAMLPFGLDGLELSEIARLAAPALLVATAHVWLLGKVAMPITSSPDRWGFMLPETVGMFISGFFLAIATAVTLFAARSLPGLQVEVVLFCALLHGGLIAVVRLVCLLLHGLIRDAGRRQVGCFLVGALGALASLVSGAFGAALSDHFAVLPGLLELNFILAAAPPALGYAFARLDSSMEGRAPHDQPLRRLALIAPLLMILLVAALPYARSIASTGDTASRLGLIDLTPKGEPVALLLAFGEARSMKSSWHQTVTIQATAKRDIKLVVDGETYDGDTPDIESETYDLSAQAGREHELRVLAYDSDPSMAPEGGRALFANAGRALFDSAKATLLLGPAAAAGDPGSDRIPAGFASVELRPGIADEEIAAIERFEWWKTDPQRAPQDAASALSGFGVALDNLSVTSAGAETSEETAATSAEPANHWRLAKGSIVHVVSGSLSLVAGRATNLPSNLPTDRAGRAMSLPANLPGDRTKLAREVAWLGEQVPDADLLQQAMTVARLQGTADFGPFVVQDWVALLLDGQPVLAELVRFGQPPQAAGEIAVNYPQLRSAGRGGLFQILRVRGDGSADAQLLKGWLRADETLEPCYRIELALLLRHPTFDAEAYRAALGSLAGQSPGEAAAQEVNVDAGKLPEDGGLQCAEWYRPPTVEEIIAGAGRYLEQFAVDLSSSEPPAVFDDYFVVVDDEGFAPPGTIVKGQEWEGSSSVYEIVQGWTDCSPTCWIGAAALTHLGPALDRADLELPLQFRRTAWSSEQDGTYAAAGWVGEGPAPAIDGAEGPQPPVAGPWASLAAAKGEWIEAFAVNLAAPDPPAVFQDYFVVVGDDGYHQGSVPPGTLVRGDSWDDDGAPSFAIVYGWSLGGARTQYLQATELAHLGAEFKPGWLQLPVLGGGFARGYDFSSWQSEFVQTICEDVPLDGCSADRPPTR